MDKILFDPDAEWIELDVNPDYLVSTHGKLIDLRSNREVPLVKIQTRTSNNWCWYVRDIRPGRSGSRGIVAARSVLVSFVGLPDYVGDSRRGGVIVYADGDKHNIRLDNLSWRVPAVKW